MATFLILPVTDEDPETFAVDLEKAIVMRNELAGASQADLLKRAIKEPGRYVAMRLDSLTVREAHAVIEVDSG